MRLLRSLTDVPSEARGCVVSIGNFDGVHVGHAQLIARLQRQAKEVGAATLVMSFHPHPAAVLRPDSAPVPLTTPERRAELLGALGVDNVFIAQTDAGLLDLTAEAFFETILIERLGTAGIVEGPNFYFGKDRGGNPSTLARLCGKHGVPLEIVSPKADSVGMVSSTRVRQLIASGDVDAANRYLTQPYRLYGTVRKGEQRGRELGFPTANLEEIPVLTPAHGVYAGVAQIAGKRVSAAVHVGPNLTFDEQASKTEVHLLDFAEDLYGQSLAVDLLQRVREIVKFSNIEELKTQMARDVARVRELTCL